MSIFDKISIDYNGNEVFDASIERLTQEEMNAVISGHPRDKEERIVWMHAIRINNQRQKKLGESNS